MNKDFKNLTITKIRDLLAEGRASVLELVDYYLDRIEKNSDLNAYLTINDKVRQEAIELDNKIATTGHVDFMEGVPIAIKDIVVTDSIRTTASSRILKNYNPPYDATIVAKLKARGALILGKTNNDEFAMGSSNENSAFGSVKNPVDISRVPGGSSGGSAAAVAADLCTLAFGTDTGGSIRQPASFCGITGLKPTYGRVSRYGLIAMTSSFDQAGPMARNIEDLALSLEVVAGLDSKDSTTLNDPVPSYSAIIKESIEGMRVAVPKQFLDGNLNKEIREAVVARIKVLEKLKVTVEEIDLPWLDKALAVYYIIMPAEVSANLARFDGIRYGTSAIADDLWQVYKMTRGQNFGDEVKRRILMGTYVLSAGYYDAYYKKALRVQKYMKYEMDKVWKDYDAIIGPTTPTTAFKLGEKVDDPLTMYLSDIYTVVANIIGSPALSMPVGNDKNGLPIGLQLMGEPLAEHKILKLAWHLENYRV